MNSGVQLSNSISKFILLTCLGVLTLMLQACGDGGGNNDWFGKVPDDYINNITNSSNVTNSYNIENSSNVKDSYNVMNSSNVVNSHNIVNSNNVTNSYNVTNCTNVTNSSNIANMHDVANVNNVVDANNVANMNNVTDVNNVTDANNVANVNNVVDDYSNLPAPNGLGTKPTQMAHNDINYDQWFNGLSREEKLCKKYLNQPSTQNLPLPTTSLGAIEYLRRALFFFPDDPNQMTQEQKELFQAPCFWAGMKMRFVEGGQGQLPFDDKTKKDFLKYFDMERYYLFTEKFFNRVFDDEFKKKFCDSTGSTSIDAYHGPAGYSIQRSCNNDVEFYSDGDPNDFYSNYTNTQLSNPIASSKYVSGLELLLVVRNIRFGSNDGINNYSHVPASSIRNAGAVGIQGYRGTHAYNYTTGKWEESHFDFKPLKVLEAIRDYGEIAVNINKPSSQMVDNVLYKLSHGIAPNDMAKLAYISNYTMQPNEDAVTKNVTPLVQYWGWQTFSEVSINYIGTGLMIHEVMHNMGYSHGNANEIKTLNNAIDIPYYIQSVIDTDQQPYIDAVDKGVIPAYYNTPQFMQAVQTQ